MTVNRHTMTSPWTECYLLPRQLLRDRILHQASQTASSKLSVNTSIYLSVSLVNLLFLICCQILSWISVSFLCFIPLASPFHSRASHNSYLNNSQVSWWLIKVSPVFFPKRSLPPLPLLLNLTVSLRRTSASLSLWQWNKVSPCITFRLFHKYECPFIKPTALFHASLACLLCELQTCSEIFYQFI